jgi:dUTP pyrophosphatase
MLGSVNAAGYDMFASEPTTIPAHGKKLVSTGVSMAIPVGNYGRIAPRSGLACKNFIDVGAGVIDADYRGELKVLLFNFGETDFQVAEGDRIAQLIIEKYTQTELV